MAPFWAGLARVRWRKSNSSCDNHVSSSPFPNYRPCSYAWAHQGYMSTLRSLMVPSQRQGNRVSLSFKATQTGKWDWNPPEFFGYITNALSSCGYNISRLFQLSLVLLSVCWSCRNKVPHTGQLRMMKICLSSGGEKSEIRWQPVGFF